MYKQLAKKSFLQKAFFLLILSIVSLNNLNASPISISVEGVITSNSSQTPDININDAFRLVYSYDSLSSDLNSSALRGEYLLSSMIFNTSSFHAETLTNGRIIIDDTHFDRYTLNSSTPNGHYALNAPTQNGRDLINIGMELSDYLGQVFSNDSHPSFPINPNDFDTSEISLLFSNNWQHNVAFDAYWVKGSISSIKLLEVTEPDFHLIGLIALFSLIYSRHALQKQKATKQA